MDKILAKIDKLKKEMYDLMDEYGLAHPLTVAKSQELDVVLNEYNKELRGNRECQNVVLAS